MEYNNLVINEVGANFAELERKAKLLNAEATRLSADKTTDTKRFNVLSTATILIGSCITVLGVLGVIAASVLSGGILPLGVAAAAVPIGALTVFAGTRLSLFKTETSSQYLKKFTEEVTKEPVVKT